MRLIDADALAIDLHEWQMEAASRGFLNDYEVLDKVLSGLDDPRYTVDPVKHGRWELDEKSDSIKCSECGKDALIDKIGVGYVIQLCSDYCPNCGARMDGDEK